MEALYIYIYIPVPYPSQFPPFLLRLFSVLTH